MSNDDLAWQQAAEVVDEVLDAVMQCIPRGNLAEVERERLEDICISRIPRRYRDKAFQDVPMLVDRGMRYYNNIFKRLNIIFKRLNIAECVEEHWDCWTYNIPFNPKFHAKASRNPDIP